MEKWLDECSPILDIEKDCIISKQGDVTVGYRVVLPEIFTLSVAEYETFHQAWIKALKILPVHSLFHKQDWFSQRKYSCDRVKGQISFLQKKSNEFFKGREYLDHQSYIFITQKPERRKESSSFYSSLLKRKIVPEETLQADQIASFEDKVSQFARVLEDSGFLKMERLKSHELWSEPGRPGILEQYLFLSSDEKPLLQDISFENGIRVGAKHINLFSLCDVGMLPGYCGPRINYDAYSTDRTKFSTGFSSALGMLLPCNHIYNQYIFIGDAQKTIRQLETKRLRLQSLSAYSRENLIAKESVSDFLNEAISQQRVPVRAHFNVMVWSEEKEELKNFRNLVSSALSQMDAVPKEEIDGAAQIHWAGIPGNAADFPMNDSFDTFLEQAVCFLNLESGYRSNTGKSLIRFGDRLSGKPTELDLFDKPMKRGLITNRGMFVCGSSGGGKSMLCNHIFRSLYDQGAHIVVVDIGGSYKGLCELVRGYYFTYTEKKPIRFNPFYLSKDAFFDTEKKESLKALLVTLWKQEHESFNRSEYVALSNAIQGYYDCLKRQPEVFPCFDSFYEWLSSEYQRELREQRVKASDFDVKNFLYVLKPYYKGGEFDYLLNAKENLGLLDQRFIVFELDNIKDHPILFPVVTLIIMELFISKVRKAPSILKVLAIEEAWKAMAKAGMAEFMKYGFKTLRKLYGIPIVVTQEIDDLISSPVIKEAIIGNSDIKILMDMRKFLNKFDGLQATLGMSEKGKTLLFSVNRANDPKRKYREFYLELGGQDMKVLRYEPSPEEYYAYTTEQTEKIEVIEYAERFGSYKRESKDW